MSQLDTSAGPYNLTNQLKVFAAGLAYDLIYASAGEVNIVSFASLRAEFERANTRLFVIGGEVLTHKTFNVPGYEKFNWHERAMAAYAAEALLQFLQAQGKK